MTHSHKPTKQVKHSPRNPLNERVTENIVRKMMEARGDIVGARIWEQIPDNEQIRKCLRHASKKQPSSGKNPGWGRPEFIVCFDKHPDFLIVVECKADIAAHEGGVDSAIGGAQHYATHLSKRYNTLAIAVSGTDKTTLRVNHFWHFKGDDSPKNAFGSEILRLDNYLEGYLEHPQVLNQSIEEMLMFTQNMNSHLHRLSIRSPHRSLLVSAILMALQDAGFANSYESRNSPDVLLQDIKNTMLGKMREAKLQEETYEAVKSSYRFMDAPGELTRGRVLVDLVRDIKEGVYSFRRTHEYYDILGHLYVEFLRYSNSDKGLGIVLTPPHITDLAVELIQTGPYDIVYDNCAGTGGFLVSAMKRMVKHAEGDRDKIHNIKRLGIVGVEYYPDIAALLSSNMFIHGDGRSNVFQGNCFDKEIKEKVSGKFKPTVGFLNPPFYTSTKKHDEMEFALNNMDALHSGGRCVALMPMQCALANKGKRLALKQKILENHTLEAVLSLPDELFHNSKTGVVTCMAIFTAHRPHPENKKTWFALCKNDGFVIKKPLGRCDPNGEWQKISEAWVQHYQNREYIAGFSTTRKVSADDEWCAEAYIDADYSTMLDLGIPFAVRDYAIFRVGREIARRLPGVSNNTEYALSSRPLSNQEVAIPSPDTWSSHFISDLFDVSGTKTTPLEYLDSIGNGKYPYVTTQATNNGVAGHFDHCTENGGVITVDSAVLGFASYQPIHFSASDHVEKLTPKFPLNPHLAMFLVAAINANRFRYSYGRKASQTRLQCMTINLPTLSNGRPDFELMGNYVCTLPFSAAII